MAVIAAGNKVILFGDFKSYWIADRQGRSFRRVDGRLILGEAMKCLAVKA